MYMRNWWRQKKAAKDTILRNNKRLVQFNGQWRSWKPQRDETMCYKSVVFTVQRKKCVLIFSLFWHNSFFSPMYEGDRIKVSSSSHFIIIKRKRCDIFLNKIAHSNFIK